MVCGHGPSIGKEAKKAGKKITGGSLVSAVFHPGISEEKFLGAAEKLGIGNSYKDILLTPGMDMMKGVFAPGMPEPNESQLSDQQGYTENDKKNLRRRQGYQSTRLTRGLLTGEPNISRPSLLGSTA